MLFGRLEYVAPIAEGRASVGMGSMCCLGVQRIICQQAGRSNIKYGFAISIYLDVWEELRRTPNGDLYLADRNAERINTNRQWGRSRNIDIPETLFVSQRHPTTFICFAWCSLIHYHGGSSIQPSHLVYSTGSVIPHQYVDS